MEAGLGKLTALGTSTGRRPIVRMRSSPGAGNAMNRSPSSKTIRFTGSGGASSSSSCASDRSGSPSQNTLVPRSPERTTCVASARCRRIPPVWSASGWDDGRTKRSGQWRAGSRGIGMPRTAQRLGSTSWSTALRREGRLAEFQSLEDIYFGA